MPRNSLIISTAGLAIRPHAIGQRIVHGGELRVVPANELSIRERAIATHQLAHSPSYNRLGTHACTENRKRAPLRLVRFSDPVHGAVDGPVINPETEFHKRIAQR